MRVAASGLGWEPEEDEEALAMLVGLGLDAVELAPTKIWPQLEVAETAPYRAHLAALGLEAVALQSLLFGRPELVLFGGDDVRDVLLERLTVMCDLAAGVGARVLVFGSPGQRSRGDLPAKEAFEVARRFFARVGERAADRGVAVCIEPLPAALGTDFVTSTAEGAELVRAVGSPGFGLHLDTCALHIGAEDVEAAVDGAADVIRHVHASEVGYGVVGTTGVPHERVARALRDVGYTGVVSVELLPAPEGGNVARVAAAVEEALHVYG